MAKVYDQKQNPDRERGTPGGPGQPMKTETRTMVMVIVAILAVIIILMVYRMAHGAEIDAALMNVPATISTLLRC